MEELMEMRKLLEAGRYSQAMMLLDEMDEMARDDKTAKIRSFLKILLLHLIKQKAEKRSTRSWEVSIANSLDSITEINKRRKANGVYLTGEELQLLIEESYPSALRSASLEAFEGQFSSEKLASFLDAVALKELALQLILNHPADSDLPEWLK